METAPEPITIDFSECECEPTQLFPLTLFLMRERDKGRSIRFFSPRKDWLHNRFNDTGLSSLMDPEYFHSPNTTGRYLPIQHFRDAQEMHVATEEISKNVLKNIEFPDRQSLSALEWLLYELCDNVIVHAESGPGALLLVDYIFEQSIARITLCDSGITIPSTLIGQFPGATDSTLIENSFGRRVGRRDQGGKLVGGGNGLYGAFRIAECTEGSFLVMSRCGTVHMKKHRSKGEETKFYSLKKDASESHFPGTYIQFSFKYSELELVNRALVFDRIDPYVWDSLEKLDTEDVTNAIIIRVADRANEVKDRQGGNLFARYVCNLAHLTRKKVILDFEGVTTVSSSFADEVFVRSGLGAQKLGVENAGESVSLIIAGFRKQMT